MEQAPQGIGHSSKLLEFKKHLDNALRHTVWFLGGPEQSQKLDACGSLPTWDIPWFYETCYLHQSTEAYFKNIMKTHKKPSFYILFKVIAGSGPRLPLEFFLSYTLFFKCTQFHCFCETGPLDCSLNHGFQECSETYVILYCLYSSTLVVIICKLCLAKKISCVNFTYSHIYFCSHTYAIKLASNIHFYLSFMAAAA